VQLPKAKAILGQITVDQTPFDVPLNLCAFQLFKPFEVTTAGEPAKIGLTVDKETIVADGRDIFHLTVQILDGKGNVVPTADNMVTFEVEGEGSLIGVDNGDPVSHEDFKSKNRSAFNGLCLAIVQSTAKPDEIQVTATSPSLRSDSVIVKSTKSGL